MKKTSPSKFRPLHTPAFIVLGVFCLIFYAALGHYSEAALYKVSNAAGLERVMLLRMVFSTFFCLLLGLVGHKTTGRIWPAATVHMIVVAFMLTLDMGMEELVHEWELSLLLIGGVGLLTLLASLFTPLLGSPKKK